MSFGISADGQLAAVSRYVSEIEGWKEGDNALLDLVKTFLVDALGRFPQGADGVGVHVDANGHVDATTGNLTVSVRTTRLLLDTPGSAPASAAAETPLF